MVKKIVEVPEGAVNVIFAPDVRTNHADEVSYMLKHQVGVENLPDAPEKRVIELPADVIAELKNIKEDNGKHNLQGFMNDVNDDSELWSGVDELNYSGTPTDALLGEWWLEHIEFVPKNESKFRIRFVDVFSAGGNDLYLTLIGNNKFGMTIYTDRAEMFTKEEADKIIADVSNSNVSLTARKVKVEE
ncbi:hypothetical protein WC29P2_00025 [Weissella phage WC29P2]|nr:hypothetical protein WC29P1_00004 [Weissella phage WC29P1]WAX18163.1 hypothetical protein WC29P2_00025 [Weissella phage WC29P2]